VFADLFAVGWPVVFGVRPKRGIAAALLSAALIVQLQAEGFRWQMIPVYLVTVGLAVGDVIFIERKLRWTNRLARGVLGTVGVALAAALPFILPVPELPTPSGPDPIGSITVEIVDRSRSEIYGPSPGGPRELTAQIWYPADSVPEDEPIRWSQDWEVLTPALSRNLGLPSWFLDHTRYTSSHAYASAPIADGAFPVVIFSHGWTGFRSVTINQIEHLASNGYIVIAPDHTYGAVVTQQVDGDVVPYDPAALPDAAEVGPQAYLDAGANLVDTFSADLVTILNELDEGETGAFAAIFESVDLNRIGLYGHSSGGGAAIKTCLEDVRCKAVLGMDPWVEPLTERDLRLAMTRPALYMRSDEWRDTPNDALLSGIAARGESVTYWLGIEGTGHNDFLVTPLLSPFTAQIGLKGPIPVGRVISIIDNYLLGFFDVYLLGTGSAALDSVTFPEVSLSVVAP